MKERAGRRNRYQVQTHLPLRVPLPMPGSRERTIGEILALLTNVGDPAAGLSPRNEEPAVRPADGSQKGTGTG